jgi:hypothetical protein
MSPLLRIALGKTLSSTSNNQYNNSTKNSERRYWPRKKPDTSLLGSSPSLTWLNDSSVHGTKDLRPKTSIHGPNSEEIELRETSGTGSKGIHVENQITWTW